MAKKYSPEWWKGLRPERLGSETEELVRTHLDKMNTQQNFTYHRMPDAKAARGALPVQPGDYLYATVNHGRRNSGFIEAKACKHPYRLARGKLSQLPKLRLFGMAGCDSYVIVNHYLDGYWRVVGVDSLEDSVPSWDLSMFETFPTVRDALMSIYAFSCVIAASEVSA